MIYLKTDEEISLIRNANQLVGQTLGELAKWVQPGISTQRLDQIAEEFIRDNGGIPGFKGYEGFPGTLCIEVNDEVVHGFPSDYILRDGDIVGLDCGAVLNGFNGDSCYTFPVGNVDDSVLKLLKTTKESLYIGIEQAKAGNRIGHIGYAVRHSCWGKGYGTQILKKSVKKLQALNVTPIYLACHIDNIGSNKVSQKVGFEFVEERINSEGDKENLYVLKH